MIPNSKRVHRKILDVITLEQLKYYSNPTNIGAFVHDLIFREESVLNGGEYDVTWQQLELLLASTMNRRVSAKAGRGVGKTASMCWLILWFLVCHPKGRVCVTAPSFPQLMSVLWPELAKWLNMSVFKDCFEHTQKKLYLHEDPKEVFCEPRTASKNESLQGLHAEHLLLIMDEASGIADGIYNTVAGSLTRKHNHIVMVANPVRTTGFFADSQTKHKHLWTALTFNSEESPIVDAGWLLEMQDKYERTHDVYRAHVLGELPTGDPDSFIPLSWVEDANYRTEVDDGNIELGVDVARMGDDATVVCTRKGRKVSPLIRRQKNTIPETVDLVLDTVRNLRIEHSYNKTIKVKIDAGGLGVGVVDMLDLNRTDNIEVIPCNFGGKGDKDYENEASIMWGNLKENLKYISLPNDRRLTEELASRRWRMSPRGKIMVEPKREYKQKFGASPDCADAVILAFARKENERVLVRGFDKVTNAAGVIPNKCGSLCSIVVSNSMIASCVISRFANNCLVITDEFRGDPGGAIEFIKQRAGFIATVVGSDKVFSDGEDMASSLFASGSFIRPAFNYNEYGSMQKLIELSSSGKLVISEVCNESVQQVSTLPVTVSHHQLNSEYGLVVAISHIVSELMLTMQISDVSTSRPVELSRSITVGERVNSGFMSI